jgi:hypothetical protein
MERALPGLPGVLAAIIPVRVKKKMRKEDWGFQWKEMHCHRANPVAVRNSRLINFLYAYCTKI